MKLDLKNNLLFLEAGVEKGQSASFFSNLNRHSKEVKK